VDAFGGGAVSEAHSHLQLGNISVMTRAQPVSIRVARPDDGPFVNELLEASYPVLMKTAYEAAVLAAALPLMTRADPALLSSGSYYVALASDGRLAGCGGWTPERPGSGEVVARLAHIRHFATRPGWLRRGVGKAIYARCEHEARAAGARQFECYASLNATGFYFSLGFREIRPVEIAMGPGLEFSSVLMQRSI
jgi:GNAT superfamily N-acetyltransferase